MIVIADTSPLHYLILLEHADVLQHLYGRVIIPEAVVRELQAQKTPAVVRRWITSPPGWLQIRQIAVPPDPALVEVDPGEREAISLAETLRADALIIDEKMGRREAQRRKLRVIGTVRVGRCGGSRARGHARCASAVAGIWVLPRRKALAIST
jgi:predicted nucleic acid-binding protein